MIKLTRLRKLIKDSIWDAVIKTIIIAIGISFLIDVVIAIFYKPDKGALVYRIECINRADSLSEVFTDMALREMVKGTRKDELKGNSFIDSANKYVYISHFLRTNKIK